ncbi:hypothetical protein ACKFKF_24860 [Phormidesmis sp. 146-12]
MYKTLRSLQTSKGFVTQIVAQIVWLKLVPQTDDSNQKKQLPTKRCDRLGILDPDELPSPIEKF